MRLCAYKGSPADDLHYLEPSKCVAVWRELFGTSAIPGLLSGQPALFLIDCATLSGQINCSRSDVDKFETTPGFYDVHNWQEAISDFVVTGRDGGLDFQAPEEALDLVALFVKSAIVVDL